jgi:hypothetical protein
MPERLEFLNPQQPPAANDDTPKPDPGIAIDAPPPPGDKTEKKGERLEWLTPTEEKDKGAQTNAVNPANIEITDPKTGLKTIMNKGAEDVKIMREKFDQELRVKQGHLPDVDYDTGTGFTDRMSLSMMDTDAERRAYLSDRYGEKNVLQDPAGTFYVTKDGKKIAPSGVGVMEGMAAEAIGHGEELALMARGAAVGGEAAGIPGTIIGAMVGMLGGKAFEEYEKNSFGLSRKSPEQTGKAYTEAALVGGAGEGLATPLARALKDVAEGGIPRLVSGATPETERLTAQTLGIGGVPPVRSALPTMMATRYHQAFGEKLTGNLAEKANLSAIEGEMKNILAASGMAPEKIPEAMKTILNTSEAPSYSALGDMTKEHAVKYQEHLTTGVENLIRDSDKALGEKFANLETQTKMLRAGDPEFSSKVAEGIAQERRDFSTSAQKIYAQIDNLMGDTPIVPTYLPKKRALSLLEKMPESEIKPIVKEIAGWRDKETFENMQRMRTRLRELGEPTNLAAAGLTKRDLRDLNTLVDQSFERTEAAIPATFPESANAGRAVRLLRQADAFYREGIRKFQDQAINQLVAGVKTGIYPDASKIVSTIFQKGQSQRAVEVLKMLPEEIRNKVKGEYATDLMTQAADKTTGMVSGTSMSRVLAGKHELLAAAFGEQTTKDIELYARQLAMRDEKIPLGALDKDRISESIRAAQKAQESLDKFMDDNFLSELAKPSLAPEAVYKHLVQPGRETELARAIQFFGAKSPQVQKLRETALLDVLHKAVAPTESGADKTIGAETLEKALSKYTGKQKALLFPNGLDKDLETLAENAKFLFPGKEGDTMAAGLAAGAVKALLPWSAPAYAWGALWNYVLTRPQTIKYLALGLNSDGPAKTVALETLRGMVRAGAIGMLPDVDEHESQQTP